MTAGGGDTTAELVELVATKLTIEEPEAAAILGRSTIHDREPSRDAIEAVNLRKLGLAAPTASVAAVRDVWRRVIERIEAAMDRRLGLFSREVGDTREPCPARLRSDEPLNLRRALRWSIVTLWRALAGYSPTR